MSVRHVQKRTCVPYVPARPTTFVQKSGSSIATSLVAPPDTTKDAFEKDATDADRAPKKCTVSNSE